MLHFLLTLTTLARMSSVFALAAPGPNSSYTYGNATTNFRVVFGSSPQPFHIDVDPNFVANTQLKASLTRLTEDIDQPDWVDGPPRHNMSHIRDYWTNDFDWFDVQAHLNAKFKQFTTTVTAGPNYTYPIPLHFVHHRSPRKDAIPLLYIHSSPGSFLEVEDIIDPLTNPLNDALPAFHVVAPDIPGFGFSPSAQQVGLGLRETGQGFDNLMSQLGYKKYVVAGGDFGALTLRHMAPDFPDSIVSVLSTFYLVYPNATDLERFAKNQTSPMENANIAVTNNIITSNGYAAIQSTTPLQLAVGMTDSPVGTAAWIYNVMYQAAPGYFWTAKQIVTWAMLYYIQGPYGAFRTYKEATEEGSFGNDFLYIQQPVGITEYPGDLGYYTPLDWCQRSANVTYFNRNLEFGGHYPSTENPSSLVDVFRQFWGNDSLSGISVFKM